MPQAPRSAADTPQCGRSHELYTKYASIPELTQMSMDVGHFRGYCGVEVGALYMAAKNVRTHLRYYYGKM